MISSLAIAWYAWGWATVAFAVVNGRPENITIVELAAFIIMAPAATLAAIPCWWKLWADAGYVVWRRKC